ncbi:hypothetical protein DFH06DRAFT_1131467 [Mycena polygramma]|nr:hypothetical protein DFH06DRAFT_1131467 [Mycena polygramma]
MYKRTVDTTMSGIPLEELRSFPWLDDATARNKIKNSFRAYEAELASAAEESPTLPRLGEILEEISAKHLEHSVESEALIAEGPVLEVDSMARPPDGESASVLALCSIHESHSAVHTATQIDQKLFSDWKGSSGIIYRWRKNKTRKLKKIGVAISAMQNKSSSFWVISVTLGGFEVSAQKRNRENILGHPGDGTSHHIEIAQRMQILIGLSSVCIGVRCVPARAKQPKDEFGVVERQTIELSFASTVVSPAQSTPVSKRIHKFGQTKRQHWCCKLAAIVNELLDTHIHREISRLSFQLRTADLRLDGAEIQDDVEAAKPGHCFLLQDLWKHQSHSFGLDPYKRLLAEIASCMPISGTSTAPTQAQYTQMYELGVRYRNRLLQIFRSNGEQRPPPSEHYDGVYRTKIR